MKRNSRDKVTGIVVCLLSLVGVWAMMVFLLVFVVEGTRGVSSHSLTAATEECGVALLVVLSAWSLGARRRRQRPGPGEGAPVWLGLAKRFPVLRLSRHREANAAVSRAPLVPPSVPPAIEAIPFDSPTQTALVQQPPAYVAPLAPLVSLPEPSEPLHVDLSDPERVNRLIAQVHAMPGMGHVTGQIRRRVAVLQVDTERIAAGEPVSIQELHMVFLGPSGVGKTTVARLYAQILCALGTLPTDRLVEVSRADLVGVHVGETAQMVRSKVAEAMGGVLFIDEAYALYNPYSQDFGHEATTELLKLMDDRRGHFVVIAAGYADKMDEWLDSNPGLRPRFSYTMTFPAYDARTLTAITLSMFTQYDQILEDDAVAMLNTYFTRMVASPPPGWSNGRSARFLVGEIQEAQSVRITAADQQRERSARQAIIAGDVAVTLGMSLPSTDSAPAISAPTLEARGEPCLESPPPPRPEIPRLWPPHQDLPPANTIPGEVQERLYLDVPFNEKEQAKDAGAQWDPAAVRWYAPSAGMKGLYPWAPILEDVPGEDRTFGDGLFVDHAPETTWYKDERGSLGDRQWYRLSMMVFRRAGYRCEACLAQRGPKQVGVHERWQFVEETSTARLVRLMCLCERCKQASQIGDSGDGGTNERARRWLAQVNGWDEDTTDAHIEKAAAIRNRLSEQVWSIDLTILGLGVLGPSSDVPPDR
ncbi:MAG: AAA family ATPase [Acidimicrobiales bacterium]